MKTNKLTPGSNMLWESSRMIIPEHKEAILVKNKKVRPILDEQELQELGYKLQMALESKAPVTIKLFDEYEDIKVSGNVTRIDPNLNRIKLTKDEDDFEWISLDDIINIEVEEETMYL